MVVLFIFINSMKSYTLKSFNSGQVTLPKKWRDQFDTDLFIAEETKEGLLIKPILGNSPSQTAEKTISDFIENFKIQAQKQGFSQKEIEEMVSKL
ncbi:MULTISPECIES: AbrB/MazE/SpoVT family DNA-binding domain-containing protein [unclassified Chryseobacterium]|uniref:AbrB/MazE/SpoVT family DNA-binding domain-containing protein n=1 Tax=unclassified Chryseobacterium TaxID=2593645 RepID=UPI000D385360|nr:MULTISPECIES: AbrB/MazE/SpoVT family DNA-binding domain-containing protein [unclassified Chryseobacterium]PTT75195.1 hypothetical protein DBR25_08900 [Chryseobacterium sp. HMWF001]PVV50728.1 AbrB/MazE/SpoVT family DNA-binding domain-containing protein [Chryseobacterium sp. HMWF035]